MVPAASIVTADGNPKPGTRTLTSVRVSASFGEAATFALKTEASSAISNASRMIMVQSLSSSRFRRISARPCENRGFP